MKTPQASLVVSGQVVLAAGRDGLETAEAIGIADGRVVSAGSEREVREAATPGARLVQAGARAVVPGLHDFHLHLVGMARARGVVDLEGARNMDALVERVASAAAHARPGSWVRGDGWHAESLVFSQLDRLEGILGGRPALLRSHDRHSAWASAAALRAAGVLANGADPEGGRFERHAQGGLTGVLRESAADLVVNRAPRLVGAALNQAIRDAALELSGFGITGVTDAGDPTTSNGQGTYAALGDSFSNLADAHAALEGLLRATANLPADGISHAAEMGLRSGQPLGAGETLQVGWAKLYADGALGSRTAALFETYTCVEQQDERGILRIGADELDDLMRRSREAGIGMAIHAIGDRAVAEVLDGIGRAPSRTADMPPDRVEHAQLVRPVDQQRFATLGVTASLQPIHLPSDRESAEACWAGRLDHAYVYRSIADSGAVMAFGSDAPIETANPWLGIFAAVRRTTPGTSPAPWTLAQAIQPATALRAYTLGPALGSGRADIGHLRPGARADLAVLNSDLETLLAADERLASVRSQLTLLGGVEVSSR
jgi:predicted amidohydrolase YtcJ